MNWEWLIAFGLGIGLSAASGIRAFLPLLIVAVNQKFHFLNTSFSIEWLDNNLVLYALIVATIIELAAYYIPLLDHALDFIATPLIFIIGAFSMTSVLPQFPAYIDNILGIIVGGSTALSMNGIMGIGRAKSTVLTAGSTNFLYATIENVTSFLLTILSFEIPILVGTAILLTVILTIHKIRKFFISNSKLES